MDTPDGVTARHESDHLGRAETLPVKGGGMRGEIFLGLRDARGTSSRGVNSSSPQRDLDGAT